MLKRSKNEDKPSSILMPEILWTIFYHKKVLLKIKTSHTGISSLNFFMISVFFFLILTTCINYYYYIHILILCETTLILIF